MKVGKWMEDDLNKTLLLYIKARDSVIMSSSQILAYPYGPSLLGFPLFQRHGAVPQWYNPAMQAEYNQMRSGYLRNVDGQCVKFDPSVYKCSSNHMNSVRQVYWALNQPYTVAGGIVTAPRYYL